MITIDGIPVINGTDPSQSLIQSTNKHFNYDNESLTKQLIIEDMGEVYKPHPLN